MVGGGKPDEDGKGDIPRGPHPQSRLCVWTMSRCLAVRHTDRRGAALCPCQSGSGLSRRPGPRGHTPLLGGQCRGLPPRTPPTGERPPRRGAVRCGLQRCSQAWARPPVSRGCPSDGKPPLQRPSPPRVWASDPSPAGPGAVACGRLSSAGVPPSLQFHFPWLQWSVVNCGLRPRSRKVQKGEEPAPSARCIESWRRLSLPPRGQGDSACEVGQPADTCVRSSGHARQGSQRGKDGDTQVPACVLHPLPPPALGSQPSVPVDR